MVTGIYVYGDQSTVTFDAGEDVALVRFDAAETKVESFRSGERRTVRLARGIYKVGSAAKPRVEEGDAEVITHSKDGDPDPTTRVNFRASFPRVTAESLRKFVEDPDLKGQVF